MDDSRPSPARIPHIGWWVLCAALLCVVALALRIGLPYLRITAFCAEVEQLGGRVETRAGGPEWLRDLLGDEAMRGFDLVVALRLEGTAIDDDWLRQMRQFPELETLRLDSTTVGDAGMALLAGLKRLRELSLFGTRVDHG